MSKKATTESPLDIGKYITQQTDGTTDQQTDNVVKEDKEKTPSTGKVQRNIKSKKKSTRTTAKDFSEDLSNSIVENFIRYDRISGECLPVTIPVDVSERLQEFVKKYHRRLSARSIVTALIETFISDFDGNGVMQQFLDRIHYVPPTEKELAIREKNALKAREQRAKKNS